MLIRGVAGSLAVILLTGSAALAADASLADASAPYQEAQSATQAPAAPVVSASGASASGPAPFPVLPALPARYIARVAAACRRSVQMKLLALVRRQATRHGCFDLLD
jgi:hypothetical protein